MRFGGRRFIHFILLLLFWLCRTACGILVPRPGIEPVPPAVEVQSLNHWTAREVPGFTYLKSRILLPVCMQMGVIQQRGGS